MPLKDNGYIVIDIEEMKRIIIKLRSLPVRRQNHCYSNREYLIQRTVNQTLESWNKKQVVEVS